MTYGGGVRLEGHVPQRKERGASGEEQRAQVDQQLQEDLPLDGEAGVHAEAGAGSSHLIGQERGTEAPVVFRGDALQELLQPGSLLEVGTDTGSGQATEPRTESGPPGPHLLGWTDGGGGRLVAAGDLSEQGQG